MITQLYTFSPGAFVVADEWNANFRSLYQVSLEHTEAIQDANNNIAFPDSDLSAVFARINAEPNSFAISGDNIDIAPGCEYYKELPDGQDLNITVPMGFESESRVLFRTFNNRTLLPFNVNYAGRKIIRHNDSFVFPAGYYYVMIFESNGVVQAKLIWTGV